MRLRSLAESENIILINDEVAQKKNELLIFIQNFKDLIVRLEEEKEIHLLKMIY